MAASLVPNTLIGARYRLERRVGQGGMAEVWLANDIALNRQVAVKLMKAHHDDDRIVTERFQREAQLSAALNHPNIVKFYDVLYILLIQIRFLKLQTLYLSKWK